MLKEKVINNVNINNIFISGKQFFKKKFKAKRALDNQTRSVRIQPIISFHKRAEILAIRNNVQSHILVGEEKMSYQTNFHLRFTATRSIAINFSGQLQKVHLSPFVQTNDCM